jgi:hypothetical protein
MPSSRPDPVAVIALSRRLALRPWIVVRVAPTGCDAGGIDHLSLDGRLLHPGRRRRCPRRESGRAGRLPDPAPNHGLRARDGRLSTGGQEQIAEAHRSPVGLVLRATPHRRSEGDGQQQCTRLGHGVDSFDMHVRWSLLPWLASSGAADPALAGTPSILARSWLPVHDEVIRGRGPNQWEMTPRVVCITRQEGVRNRCPKSTLVGRSPPRGAAASAGMTAAFPAAGRGS